MPSGEQATERGIPLSQNAQDQEPHIYSPPDKIFILMPDTENQRNLNAGFIATNRKNIMQTGVLGFVQQAELLREIRIRNDALAGLA